MKTDSVMDAVILEVANETGNTIADIQELLDIYYKSNSDFIRNGEPRIKHDFLGSFNLKPIKENDNRPDNSGR